MSDQHPPDEAETSESESFEPDSAPETTEISDGDDEASPPIDEERGSDSDEATEDARTVVEADSVDGETVNIAEEIHHTQQWIENSFFGERGATIRELTYGEFVVYSGDKLGTFEAIANAEDAVLQRMVERLQGIRVALIVGARALGKGACALTAGARLAHGGKRIEEVLTVAAPTRDLRVPLKALLKKKRFESRVVVLEDAFDRDNTDLVRFVERLDKAQLATLTDQLKHAGSYLILTTVPDRLPSQASHLTTLGIVTELQAPPPELLLEALHRKVECLKDPEPDRQVSLHRLLESHGEQIATHLGSVPRILRFVDAYLIQVLEAKLTVEEALGRVDDLEHWLLVELPEQDLEAWSFVLALILASSEPTSDWVPWLPFHRLWREVAKALEVALGNPLKDAPRVAGDLVIDPRFLSRARAVIAQIPFPVGECVRFQEGDYPARLWQALLGSGRRILSLLLDRLHNLVERGDPAVRQIAAQALGRAAELDPRTLFFPKVAFWSRSMDDRHHSALGACFCGVLASGDGHHRAGCFHRLRQATSSQSPVEVRAGLLALSQVGMFDLPFAMAELRRSAEQHLGQHIEEVTALNQALRALQADLEELSSVKPDRRLIELQHRDLLEKLAPHLFNHFQAVVLGTIQYALVGLCFGRNPLQVFDHLTDWMSSEKSGLAPLVALISLRANGILDILERHPVILPPADSGDEEHLAQETSSRILAALRSDDEVLDLRDFLQALYRRSTLFPAWFQNQLHERLWELLRRWGEEASKEPRLEESVIQLFAALLDSSEPRLSESTFDLLKLDGAFRDEDGALSSLASVALGALPPRRTVSRRTEPAPL